MAILTVIHCPPASAQNELRILFIRSPSLPDTPQDLTLKGFRKTMESSSTAYHLEEDELPEEASAFENAYLDLVKKQFDFVLTSGSATTQLARAYFGNIPVIYTLVLNPQASNISPPGINVDLHYELVFEKLNAIFKDPMRIGTICSENSRNLCNRLSEIGESLNQKVVIEEVSDNQSFFHALKALQGRYDVFLMIPDPTLYYPKTVEYLLKTTLEEAIPTVGLSSAYTKAGALVSFECNYEHLGEQAAELSLHTFKDGLPGSSFVVRHSEPDYSLNVSVAKHLGIKFDSAIIKQARQVFGK